MNSSAKLAKSRRSRSAMAFSKLRTRVITAAFLIAVFVGLLVLSSSNCLGRWVLLVVACAAQAWCAYEFGRLSTKEVSRFTAYMAICLIPAFSVLLTAMRQGICGTILFSMIPFALACGIFLSILAAVAYALWSGRQDLAPVKDIANELVPGVLLVGIGGGSLAAMAALPHASWVVAWLFLVVCVNDIAAYFGGSHFKGAKFAPALSPNKTVSGHLCGFGGGLLAGVYAQSWLGFSAPIVFFIAFTLLVVAAAQAGDLLKSYAKRCSGVKDSGSMLPGHGGLLDRLDGVLLSGPLVYIIVVWMLRL